MITIIHTPFGSRVDCSCVVQNGLRLTPCTGGNVCDTTINYIKGLVKPNFPVPATDKVALLSMPYEALTIRTKLWLLDK